MIARRPRAQVTRARSLKPNHLKAALVYLSRQAEAEQRYRQTCDAFEGNLADYICVGKV